MTPYKPLIALVGRPNVGKSSLFNRLTRTRAALVDNTPGLTRDRQYGVADLQPPARRTTGRQRRRSALPPPQERPGTEGAVMDDAVTGGAIRLVDTGGFESESGTSVTEAMREQTLLAIQEADAIVFVTDAHTGPLADDWAIAELLRRSGKPLVCAINKAEGHGGREMALEFHRLGLSPLVHVSATHGMGIAPLMQQVMAEWTRCEADKPPPRVDDAEDPDTVRVAVVGCPNAGKSTLINQLLGETRLVVADMPGTTRDTIDLPFIDPQGHPFVLVDTAGIRRKSRIALRIEKYAVLAAMRAMDRAHVAILLLDAVRGITDQDRRVANLALESGCGLVLAINKWDAYTPSDAPERRNRQAERRLFLQEVQRAFPSFTHAPVRFLSAKTGLGVADLLPAVRTVWQAGHQRVSTGTLNRWLVETIQRHPPPRTGGRVVKIRYVTQVSAAPPTFIFFTNRDVAIHATYRRYLEGRLRTQFGFSGVPFRISFRSGADNNPYVAPMEQRQPSR